MMSKHEVNKDALCVVVMPKMGLVYIPGMSSKEAVWREFTESAETVQH